MPTSQLPLIHTAHKRIATTRHCLPLALLLLNPVLGAQGQSALPPAAEQQLAREIYKEMIEIKSGYTTGATTPVAEAAARRLKAAGFPDADIFVGGAIPTKANLVVRYRGTGRARPLLLLAHTDVVEAKREDWSHGSVHASPSATATSTAAAPATTRRRRRSGSPT